MTKTKIGETKLGYQCLICKETYWIEHDKKLCAEKTGTCGVQHMTFENIEQFEINCFNCGSQELRIFNARRLSEQEYNTLSKIQQEEYNSFMDKNEFES